MYLITTINLEECGWEIVEKGTKSECEAAREDFIKKVWHNEDGSKKMMSDIYDDTRAKNCEIVTNAQCVAKFGGMRNLEMAEDYRYEILEQQRQFNENYA